MNFRNKIAAFTLMELLVVMLLSTFVFIMGLTAFQITNKLYQNYEELTDESLDLDQFRSLLSHDIYKAEQLYLRDGNLICQRADIEIIYQIGEAVVRTANQEDIRLDTLWKEALSYEASFENEVQTSGPIDQFILELNFMEKAFRMSFQKPKDAAYYLKQSQR